MALGQVLSRRIVKLTRCRAPDDKGKGTTLFFTFPAAGRGRSQTGFLHLEHFPLAFDDEAGWFEIEKVSAKPWPYWRAVRQAPAPPDVTTQDAGDVQQKRSVLDD